MSGGIKLTSGGAGDGGRQSTMSSDGATDKGSCEFAWWTRHHVFCHTSLLGKFVLSTVPLGLDYWNSLGEIFLDLSLEDFNLIPFPVINYEQEEQEHNSFQWVLQVLLVHYWNLGWSWRPQNSSVGVGSKGSLVEFCIPQLWSVIGGEMCCP